MMEELHSSILTSGIDGKFNSSGLVSSRRLGMELYKPPLQIEVSVYIYICCATDCVQPAFVADDLESRDTCLWQIVGR